MKSRAPPNVIEGALGLMVAQYSTRIRGLTRALYVAQVASNIQWMRELTRRGGVSLNTGRAMTHKELGMH